MARRSALGRGAVGVRTTPFRYSITGARQVALELRQSADRTVNLKEPFEDFGEFYRAQLALQFATGGKVFGSKPWAPLMPSTIAKKSSNVILVDSGGLLRSYTVKRARGNISLVKPAANGRWTGTFGSRYENRRGAPVAKLQQFGFNYPFNGLRDSAYKGMTLQSFIDMTRNRNISAGRRPYYAVPRPVVLANQAIRRYAREKLTDHILEPVKKPGGASVR